MAGGTFPGAHLAVLWHWVGFEPRLQQLQLKVGAWEGRVLLGGLQLNLGAGVVPFDPNSRSFTSNGGHFCQPDS